MRFSRFVLLISFILTMLDWSVSRADEVWQSWSGVSLEGVLSERWRMSLTEEFHIKHSEEGLYFHRSDLGINYKANSWLRLSLYYWHDYHRKNDSWIEERRLHGHVTMGWKIWKLSMRHRSRIEWRFLRGTSSFWRYRYMLKVILPSEWLPFGSSGYFGNELFFDLRDGLYHQNRFKIGITRRIKGPFHIDLYFMLKSDRSSAASSWKHTPLIGQKLKFVF